MPRLFLIDGYATIFRAFFATPPLSNSKGQPTNAVYAFVNMLRKLLREEKPELVGVALDVAGKTVRSERFSDYKATRAPMPDDLRPQIPYIRQALDAFRIPKLELANYEADDVLGTLARKAAAAGFEVVLVSPDKDLLQLVASGVSLYHTGREKLYDPAAVEEDFGLPPEKVVDVLALMGDSVDNVPGVPGIGEKGAKNLIKEYGSLHALLERAAEVPRKSYREGLQAHREQAELSRELVTIHCDLPVELDPEALSHDPPDEEALRRLYAELEFRSLLEELGASPRGAGEGEPPAEEAATADAWRAATAALPAQVVVAVLGEPVLGLVIASAEGMLLAPERASVEGSPLTPTLSPLRGARGSEIANAAEGRRGDAAGAGPSPPPALLADLRRTGLKEAALATLDSLLADPGRTLLGHDLKEVLRLSPSGPTCRAALVDLMLVSYLGRPAQGHGLSDLATGRLGTQLVSAKEAGWDKGQEPALGSAALLAFAGERAGLVRRLAPAMLAELGEGATARVYREIEAPLVPVLLGMEEAGVLLDVAYLAAMSRELALELRRLETEIYELAGETFNIHSPQQLGVILFEKLGYPAQKKTRKTKSYATGAEVLEDLAAKGYPLPERLLRFREVAKLKSTYVDTLPALVAADGRLHTRYYQAVAATGRLSSANPNLQNIPVRGELGQRIRRAFVAAPGSLLLVADYSQIELRVLAHIAGEEALVEAFRRGEDIHRTTAASVFGVAPDLVTTDQRRAAKTINFGILYGISGFGLAQNLGGISPKEASAFIQAYLDRLPAVRRYLEETEATAKREGKVETLYGRARWLPEIASPNWNVRENARRMAINARIQGTAADLQKMAMIRVDRRLRAEHPEARLLLSVHDELVLEVPAGEVEAVGILVKAEMEGAAELAAPLAVDVAWGPSWYEAKA